MDSFDYWRLCDELNVVQAALLIVGVDPSEEQYEVERRVDRPPGYEAARTAVINAVLSKALPAARFRNRFGEFGPEGVTHDDSETNWTSGDLSLTESRIRVEDLRRWLATRGLRSGFFFPNPLDGAEYLDPKHPRYAPKLAAAVNAWQQVNDTGKSSAKQALMKWLREHAAEFQLTDADGKLNEKGIEECAKVANWRLEGGAPSTPGNPGSGTR